MKEQVKYPALSKRLQKFLEDKRWGTSELLDELAVHMAEGDTLPDSKTVRNWINGDGFPTTDRLIPLSEMLGVTVDELLKDIADQSAKKRKQNNLQRIASLTAQEKTILHLFCQASEEGRATLYFMLDKEAFQIYQTPLSRWGFFEAYKNQQKAELLPDRLEAFFVFFLKKFKEFKADFEKNRKDTVEEWNRELERFIDIGFVEGEEFIELYNGELYKEIETALDSDWKREKARSRVIHYNFDSDENDFDFDSDKKISNENIESEPPVENKDDDRLRRIKEMPRSIRAAMYAWNIFSYGEINFDEAEVLGSISKSENKTAVIRALDSQKENIRLKYFEPLERAGLIEVAGEEFETVATDYDDEVYHTFAWRVDIKLKLTKEEAESFAGEYFVKTHFSEEA